MTDDEAAVFDAIGTVWRVRQREVWDALRSMDRPTLLRALGMEAVSEAYKWSDLFEPGDDRTLWVEPVSGER